MPFAPVGTPAPPSRALPRIAIALLACLALYGIDLACMATVPATGFDFASGFAVPFDLMVCVPAAFYLLVVRRRGLTPLAVLPVVWAGYLAASQLAAPGLLSPLAVSAAAGSAGTFSLLPPLFAASLYALLWLVAAARASVLNPLLVDDETLTVRWAAFVCEDVPLRLVTGVGAAAPDVPKRERLDLGVMGAPPCWIELSEPLEVRTLAGTRRPVRAINVSPDNADRSRASRPGQTAATRTPRAARRRKRPGAVRLRPAVSWSQ